MGCLFEQLIGSLPVVLATTLNLLYAKFRIATIKQYIVGQDEMRKSALWSVEKESPTLGRGSGKLTLTVTK